MNWTGRVESLPFAGAKREGFIPIIARKNHATITESNTRREAAYSFHLFR
jgi:hypothetical protein